MIPKYLGSDLNWSSNLGCNAAITVARTQRLGLTFTGKSWVGRVEAFKEAVILWSNYSYHGGSKNHFHTTPHPFSSFCAFLVCLSLPTLYSWGYLLLYCILEMFLLVLSLNRKRGNKNNVPIPFNQNSRASSIRNCKLRGLNSSNC